MEVSSPPRFCRIGEVLRRYAKKRSTLYAEVQRGEFPAPIRIGTRQSAWRESDLVEWETSLAAKTAGQR